MEWVPHARRSAVIFGVNFWNRQSTSGPSRRDIYPGVILESHASGGDILQRVSSDSEPVQGIIAETLISDATVLPSHESVESDQYLVEYPCARVVGSHALDATAERVMDARQFTPQCGGS